MTIMWENILWAILAFGILYWALNKFAFGKLFDVMEKRRQLVLNSLNEAAESREQAKEYIAQQKQELDNARKDAYQIIEQARVTSAKQSEEIIKSAQEESSRLKQEALNDIEAEKSNAVAAIRSEVGGISVQIASKIIEKQIDEKSQKELVDQYLKEVKSK